MISPKKRPIKAFFTRLVILLVVYLLAVVGLLSLLHDLLPNPAGHPWGYVLYALIVVSLFAALVAIVEISRKKRK